MSKKHAITGKKHNSEFQKFLREITTLDPKTGVLSFKGAYVHLGVNVCWNNTLISASYANVVWFVSRERWPDPGYVIDHINDDPFDNRPENLQEITEAENQAKRRGRLVYRNYGSGKYGYGVGIHHDRRDDRYYVSRHMSRGHGAGELKTIKKSFGGYNTLAEAKAKVEELIEAIKKNGLDWVPPAPDQRKSKSAIERMLTTQKMRKLRKKGYSLKSIAKITGYSMAAVSNKTCDLGVDKRLK